MTKTREIGLELRAQIIGLHQHTTKSYRQIGRDLSVHHTTVSRVIKTHKETGTLSPKKRTGRPRKTTSMADRRIRRAVIASPFITASKIQTSMSPILCNVSVRTIQRRLLKDFSLPARKPLKKPALTKKMIKKRIRFCRQYQNWTFEEWKNVLFSDESTFKQNDCAPRFVRRPVDSSPLNPRFTVKTVKHSPGFMVWGCFGHMGPGTIKFLEKGQRMNSEVYISILNASLTRDMEKFGCTIFQQDNAPCHTSKRSLKWFSDKSIEILEWPGNSPDLNPIENLWQILKEKIDFTYCKTLTSLEKEVNKIWTSQCSNDICAKLVASMPQRIKAVLENKGYPCKY